MSADKDIQIIPESEGEVTFSVLGASADCGLLLLQRLYAILLSDRGSGYRDGDSSSALLQYLDGGNVPSAGVLDAALALACSDALDMLDDEDRERIESFTGTATPDGDSCRAVFQLELTDGTTITGVLDNV